VVLDHGREMGIIAAVGPRTAALLAPGPTRRWGGVRRRAGRFGRRGGLGLSTEELLLPEAEQRLEPVHLGLELSLAFEGAAMHGLPIGGLSPGLKLLFQARANRTGAVRDGRSRADRTGR